MENTIKIDKETIIMLNKDVLKTVGSIAKGAFGIFSMVVVAGLLGTKACDDQYSATYNEAVNAIANGDLWSSDKPKVLDALKPNFKPVVYKAVVEVVKSDMWTSDKANVIIKMCKQAEES